MSVRKRNWTTRKGLAKEAYVVDYVDQAGVRHIKTFPRKKDAVAWETKMRGEVVEGRHVADSSSVTVKEATDIWINAVKRGRGDRGPAEASTLRQYQYHADTYILPMLGKEKLSRLSKARIMAFRDDLINRLSRPLAKKVLTSLKGILSEAQERNLVALNAAAKVKIGKGDRENGKQVFPSVVDVKAILRTLDEKATDRSWRRRRALIATAIHTGLRASEIRGLPWSSVDLKGGKISVTQRADEKGVIGPLKNKFSYRTVSVPDSLVKLLREWKVECPASARGLVFPTEKGNPESLANIYNRAWKPVSLKAGVTEPKLDESGKAIREDGKPILQPRYNFHMLRHFHASMLIADGANPKEVQHAMGHASIQITYDIYGHLFKDEDADRRRQERSERLAGKLA